MIDLTPADATQISKLHALIHRSYRGETARRGWTHEADLLDGQRTDADALRDMVADPCQHLLAAWQGDEPFACIALTEKGDGLVYVGMVTVDPQSQGRGLGRHLLDRAEQYAVAMLGARRAEMTVISLRTELINWYERRGYALTGERRPFPSSDPRFGLPTRHLEFVVMEKPLTA
nr:GNAT family N-acetyltransferase [uncultured Sphingomonas sp.]